MQELPRLSRWGICVHSSPSAVRKIISFWKTRKREAEGFDNEALRIRGHCFASGWWVKSQGAEEGVQEAAPTIQKTQLPLSDDDTGNHRKCQHTFPKTSVSMWCLSFYFLPFYYFFSLFFSSSSSASTTSPRMLYYLFWLLWTTGNTLLLLVNQVHAIMHNSQIKHSWICWKPQGWCDSRRSCTFSQKVILGSLPLYIWSLKNYCKQISNEETFICVTYSQI